MSENITAPKTGTKPSGVETRQGVILNIESGLLSGSERFIDTPGFVIGSGKEADILLLDEGIAPVHLVVSITRSMLGVSISVHALADNVIVDGQHLGIEQTSHGQQSLQFNIAGIDLKIQDAKGYTYKVEESETDEAVVSQKDQPPQQHVLRPAFLAVSALLCFGISVFLLMYSYDGGTLQANSVIGPEVPDEKSRDKFILQLKQKVKEADLDNLLEVRKRSTNGIEVVGSLGDIYAGKWLTVLQWYDSQPNAPLLFNQVGKATGKSNLPRIKFAWFGKDPYIVLQDNQKVTIGETINSGWKVDTVDAKGIVLTQADNRVLLKFE